MGEHTKQASATNSDTGKSSRSRSGGKVKHQHATGQETKDQVRGSGWDQRRADRVIAFLEELITPSGTGQGEAFLQRQFQVDFVNDVYSPCDENGLRIVRQAVFSMARKNGKTAEIAGLALCHLVGPEAITNGEIYSAATEREQAGQVYKMASQMVRACPELSGMLKCIDSTKTIACYHNGSFYRALSSEDGSKHGMNPSVVIYDELAQAKNRKLFDALDTAGGARAEPLLIVISTQSNDPQHILSELIDDGLRTDDPTIVTHLYAVPDDVTAKRYCETCDKQYPAQKKDNTCPDCGGDCISAIYDEREWYKANPALGDFRNIEDMRAKARRAKRAPSFEAAFRNLYLNQRVDAKNPLISRAEWMGCEGESDLIPGEDIILGLDLSATTDLCSLVALSAGDDDRVKAWFWKPGDTLLDHEDRDRVPYAVWRDHGYINTPPGRSVDYGFIAQFIAELMTDYNVIGLAYDRWRVELLLKEFAAIGVDSYVDSKDNEMSGGLRLVPFGQGFKDMAPAIDALEISILDRKFKHDGNPVLTWCFSNAIAVADPSGNRKLDKSKTRFRIDGAVAAAMAVGLKAKDMQQDTGKSFWE